MFHKYIQASVVVAAFVLQNAFAVCIKGMFLVFLFWVWLHAATSPCLRKSPVSFPGLIITTHWKENLANFLRKKLKKFSTKHKKARLHFLISRVF